MRQPPKLVLAAIVAVIALIGAAALTLVLRGGESHANPIAHDPLPPRLFAPRELTPIAAQEDAARTRGVRLASTWLARHPSPDDAAFAAYVKQHVPKPPSKTQLRRDLPLLRALDAGRDATRRRAVAWLFLHGKKDVWKLFEKQYGQLYGKKRAKAGKKVLKATIALANLINTDLKHSLREPHPLQLDPSLNPILPHPGKTRAETLRLDRTKFGYPSNHTNISYAAATLLAHLEPARAGEFFWMANEVSYSRLVAGVHFPVDLVAGALEGSMIGEYEAHYAAAK